MSFSAEPKFLEIFQNWIKWMKNEKQYSLHTIESYNSDLSQFFRFLNEYFLQDINIELIKGLKIADIRSWFSKLKLEDINTRSLSRHLSAIRNFYLYLKKNHQIINTQALNLTIRNNKHSLPKAIEVEETTKFINEILYLEEETWVQYRDYALINLIYGCGLRISEALSVKKHDIEGDFLKIFGKGKKQRNIPLLPEVKLAIIKYLQSCPYNINKDQNIFIGKKGRELNPSVFQKRIRLIRRNLGLPDNITPHSFRHSFASHLLENGADLRSIQELLGHENLSTTQIYTSINKSKIINIYLNAHPRK